MVSSLLDHAAEIKPTEDGIDICFPRQSNFHFEILQSAENLQLLKEVLEAVVGKRQEVRITLTDSPPVAQPSPNDKTIEGDAKVKLTDRIKHNPAVQSFLETFKAEITDIKDLEK
jgi:hypothetical protein